MRLKLGDLVWVCVLMFGSSCFGRFVVEKNNLRITSPESVKGTYECAIGNFGVPQYGGTMVGSIFYPKSNRKGCRNFQDADISWKNRRAGIPVFLLADRGGTYVIYYMKYMYGRC